MRPRSALAAACSVCFACACGALTREEAREALDEIQVASQALSLTSGAIELSTDFTIGEGVQTAAEELRDAIAAALPCAEIALSPGQLGIEYGARPGACSQRGQPYRGQHLINVSRNDPEQVVIDHVWNDLDDGRVRVDGTATVTYDLLDQTRHIVHEAHWLRLRDGRTGEGSGDRVQRPLVSGFAEGFGTDGQREWRGRSGRWELAMNDVEMRWADPVPRAGRYTLATPFGESVTATFTGTGPSRIRVTVAGKRRSFDFEVEGGAEE